jgi:Zn-dependent protease with chaperone function
MAETEVQIHGSRDQAYAERESKQKFGHRDDIPLSYFGVPEFATRVPGSHHSAAVAAVAAVITLASLVFTLPVDYYSDFIFPHQYGLSNQTTLQWLRDFAVGEGIGLATGVPLLLLLYWLLRRAPHAWWIWLAAASVPLSIFVMLIQPVFIAPLFNKFTRLQNAQLRQDILTMAHRQGIHPQDIYQVDASRQSNAVNAYVNGFGPTQRIVLYDTLLKNFTHEEIEFVMAHEMGHYVLGHIYQGIAFSILGTLLGSFALYRITRWLLARHSRWLGFESLGNPASYPLLAALGMIVSLIALPVGNAFSRNLEWQADRFAVQVFPHPDAGISAFHKLGRFNVAEENPPRWAEILFGSHPSLAERIAALEQVKAGHPNPWPLPKEVDK